LLVAPEQLEPLLLSRGLISELPTHAHGDEAKPKGPVQVQTSHVTAAEVPVDITGTGVLRSLGPKEEGWELSVPIAGPYVDQVHPRGELSIHWNGPGWYTNHISAVRPAGDGGKEAVAILPNNNDARADDHPEVRIPVGKHAGWLAPDHSVFSGPGDLHLLEVTPASPPMAGRGRIRKHALRVTNLEGKIQIEPISGVLVDGMIVVVGGEDLPEGAEVVLAPAP
jgi:hypothetical protein